MEKKVSGKALLPFGVFVGLYLITGIVLNFMGVEMAFYQLPAPIAAVVGVISAFVLFKGSIGEKMTTFLKGCGHEDIMTMCMIFLFAGAFTSVSSAMGGVDSVVNLGMTVLPPQFIAAGVFVISAFISISTGTSVGTVTAVTPIALGLAQAGGLNEFIVVGATIGGSMFGDNLSFISDTTIAACNGQGCDMKDKFKENLGIALPAAIATCVIIVIMSITSDIGSVEVGDFDLIRMIPYLVVLIGGIIGINVFGVLILGIITAAVIMLGTEAVAFTDMITNMGDSISGMFETSMVAILVAAICALIAYNGGFKVVLSWIRRKFKSKKGGMLGIGLLVGALDVSTANNTVAIIMANPIAKEIANDYDISPKRTASLLDIFSCIFQGIIPYGAQMLVAVSLAVTAGLSVSAFDVIPNLFYPFMLLIATLIFIFFPKRKKAEVTA